MGEFEVCRGEGGGTIAADIFVLEPSRTAKNCKKPVLGIRNILVRIRIPGSVPLTNRSGSNSGSDSSLILRMQKNISFYFFSYNLPTGTSTLV